MTLQEGAEKSILLDRIRQSCQVGGVADEAVRFKEIPPLGVRLKSPHKFCGPFSPRQDVNYATFIQWLD
jgi:hypothetical protein